MSNFTPQTKFYLLHNVDIDNSYTHEYYFETQQAQYNFFYGKRFKTVENGTYQRKNSNQINIPFNADEIADCKYIMWQNNNYSSKWYYAFVTSIDYVNPSLSTINYVLDVYQTFLFDMEWKQSFIEREHTERYVNGKPVVNVLDEGLDYGDIYRTMAETPIKQTGDTEGNLSFLIIGTTNSSNNMKYGGVPTRLSYYVIPFDPNAYRLYKVISGGTTYALDDIDNVLSYFQNDSRLVNTLISAVVVPYLSLGSFTIDDSDLDEYVFSGSSLSYATVQGQSHTLHMLQISDSTYWRIMNSNLGNKYTNFPTYDESKLLMYPYSFIELTNKEGCSMIVKPEYINGDNLEVGVWNVPSNTNKTVALIKDYINTGWGFEHALVDTRQLTLPILDDYSASYLQANNNSNRIAISNAEAELNTARQIAENNRTLASQNNINSLGGNLVSGGLTASAGAMGLALIASVASGGLTLPLVGALAGASATALGGVGSLITSAENSNNAINDYKINFSNAMLSAQKTYQATVNSVLAKVQDAEQIPPNMRAIGDDYLFNSVHGLNKFYIRYKTIKPEYVTILSDYFKQYGYKVNKLENPQFHTRASWNYIKMSEPNVYGNIPMDDLSTIKNIFSKGITLWHGDYIGNYSRNNDEI